jgi:hypothetical protein
MAKKGATLGRGSRLAQEGVALARVVGGSLRPFACVVASASPRAIETAIAMGLAVNDTVDLPSGYLPGVVDHHEQWRWPAPYRRYADLLQRSTTLATVAEAGLDRWPATADREDDRFVGIQFHRVRRTPGRGSGAAPPAAPGRHRRRNARPGASRRTDAARPGRATTGAKLRVCRRRVDQ